MNLSKKLPSSIVVKSIKIEVRDLKHLEMNLSTQFSIEDTMTVLKECQKSLEREASQLPIKKG
jgi:hypothetical protein